MIKHDIDELQIWFLNSLSRFKMLILDGMYTKETIFKKWSSV